MLGKEREQEIINLLKTSNGFVTVKQLCAALFASESSIRRDLKSLEERGLVKRSYGGASSTVNHSHIVTFNQRTRNNAEAKKAIAQKAASLIQDGDVVFLDQSSSAFYLANELLNRSLLTVVTNNIEIVMLLSHSAVKVISSGGILSGENRSCLVGDDAQATFENIVADWMFFSVKSISKEGCLTDCSREEVFVRNAMFKTAQKKVLLCDSSKFGTHATFKQCELPDLDYLISEDDRATYFSGYEDQVRLL